MKTSMKYIILLFFFTFCQILPQGNTIYLDLSVRFQDITKTSQYRMIGLPGDIDLPLARFMTGTPNNDWTAFYDDGEGMYTAWTSTSSGNFYYKPGQAYWVISKFPIIVDSVEANAVTLQNDSAYSISLKPGWNMITSPFIEPVNYEYVRQLNNIPDNLYYFRDGRFYTYSLSMEPYLGYYLYNRYNLQSLKIPHPDKNVTPQKTNEILCKSISLNLMRDADTLSSVILGIAPQASDEIDELDQFMPPGNFCNGSLKSNIRISDKQYSLGSDFRPVPEQNIEQFSLRPEGDLSGTKLVFSHSGSYDQISFYILLSDGRIYQLLSDHLALDPRSYMKNGTLRIIAGEKTVIESNKNKISEYDFNLAQNYPNPFNPATKIKFSIPEACHVTLRVFNSLGQEIKMLLNSTLEAGDYEEQFNASNLPSGVYFYQLEAGEKYQNQKKMLLLK